MSELPALEAALIDAARRHRGRQRPAWRRPVAGVLATGAVLALALALIVLLPGDDVEREATPAGPAAGGFTRQLDVLGVLRQRTAADDDPQVRQQVRDWKELQPRATYARLLAKAPSGGAFVLVPVRRIQRPGGTYHRDGLCLMRRGTQGGVGICGSTEDLQAGNIRSAIAGQVFGVVPDGIKFVRPTEGAEGVPVRRNFYVYDDPRTSQRGPIPPPALCTQADVCTAVAPHGKVAEPTLRLDAIESALLATRTREAGGPTAAACRRPTAGERRHSPFGSTRSLLSCDITYEGGDGTSVRGRYDVQVLSNGCFVAEREQRHPRLGQVVQGCAGR